MQASNFPCLLQNVARGLVSSQTEVREVRVRAFEDKAHSKTIGFDGVRQLESDTAEFVIENTGAVKIHHSCSLTSDDLCCPC
jgi:hypothetical protein